MRTFMRTLPALLTLTLPLTAPAAEPATVPAAAPPASQPATQPAPAELTAAIRDSIKLLEQERYADLLKFLAEPADLARKTQQRSLEEIASQFAGPKAQALLAALRAADKATPVLNDDHTQATYTLDNNGRHDTMKFLKIDGRWYLKD